MPTSQDFLQEYHNKHQSNEAFKSLLAQRSHLPVAEYRPQLVQAMKEHRVIIIRGATGCGKTTQVTDENSSHCNITQ